MFDQNIAIKNKFSNETGEILIKALNLIGEGTENIINKDGLNIENIESLYFGGAIKLDYYSEKRKNIFDIKGPDTNFKYIETKKHTPVYLEYREKLSNGNILYLNLLNKGKSIFHIYNVNTIKDGELDLYSNFNEANKEGYAPDEKIEYDLFDKKHLKSKHILSILEGVETKRNKYEVSYQRRVRK